MPLSPEFLRVAIVGATSLPGKDLKQWMEESGFPFSEVRLFDEEGAAGALTDVGGEPAVVQVVDETSFERARFVFLTGPASFAARNAAAALRAGATVIDLSGVDLPGIHWVPVLDSLLPPPEMLPERKARIEVCASPSTPAIVASALSVALSRLGLLRLTIVFLRPVSERGQAGVAELEGQTGKLLSLQAIPQDVFDAQVAFNLLDHWGPDSAEKLSETRDRVSRETALYLAGRAPVPALTLIQAPVFFGYGFSAYAEFSEPPAEEEMRRSLEAADFKIVAKDDPGPSNQSVAGETQANIRMPERDRNSERGYWFWGAADNLRLVSVNAIRIAERLLAS